MIEPEHLEFDMPQLDHTVPDRRLIRRTPSWRLAVASGVLGLYGGNNGDAANGLTLDGSDNAYVVGNSTSTDLPMAPGAEQATKPGSTDAFLAEFNPAGTQLVRSTYLGGPGSDNALNVARDPASGLVYVVGTAGTGFPTTNNAFQQTNNPAGTGFLTVLSPPGEQTDVGVTQSASAPSVVAGNPVTFTVTVTNTGPGTAAGITLTDTLPPGVTVNSATMSPTGTCGTPSGTTLTCSIAALFTGASTTATIQLTPTTVGTATNAVSVSSATTDPNPANNSASTDVTVTAPPSADLSIVKTASPSTGAVGTPLTYTLAVHNAGPDPAIATTVSDTLPPGESFVSSSTSQGSCSGTATVGCNLGTLASGGDATVTITVTPTTTGNVVNTATVSSSNPDPTTANNTSTVSTPVSPGTADLSITQTDSPDPAATGGALTYTLTVHNAGPSAASSVSVTDTLPAGASFGSATPSQGSCAGTGPVTCTLGTLASEGNATISLALMAPTTTGTITNTASVSAAETDPNTADNTSSENTVVNSSAGLANVVVKTTTTPMTNGSASAINVTATCPSGTVLTGGGAYLRNATSAATTPNNGLKLNGTIPSDTSGNPVANNAPNPGSWTAVAGFGGQSESGDQASAFALCTTNGPPSTSTTVSAPVSINTEFTGTTPNTPLKTTATCPTSTRLVGGGALGTPASQPSFKPGQLPLGLHGQPSGQWVV